MGHPCSRNASNPSDSLRPWGGGLVGCVLLLYLGRPELLYLGRPEWK